MYIGYSFWRNILPICIDLHIIFIFLSSAAIFLLFLLFAWFLLQGMSFLPDSIFISLIFANQFLPNGLEEFIDTLAIFGTGIFEHSTKRVSIFFGLLVRNSLLIQINFVSNNGHH